jgi:NAD(P)-dependent dehydrogenase (short-subunit alcohol dehydrogenase family)
MAFRGKVALITGAASGMGQLSAWRLAAGGAQVAAIDVDEGGLAATERRAPSVHAYRCDVSDAAAVQQVVDRVEAELGPIDRVVNAAAIAPTAPLLEQPVEEIRRLTEINYLGSVYVTRAALPAMIERGSGDLVQYASLAGWLPSPYFGAYSATKFAVVAFSEVLYHENLGSGVRMVCVCPPLVDTPLLEQVARRADHMLSASTTISPHAVLDAVEAGLEKGEFFVYPGPGTRLIVLLRRVLPGLLWQRLHQVDEANRPAAETASDAEAATDADSEADERPVVAFEG